MHALSSLVKTTIPNYLSGLPIPDTIGGWFKLGVKDWMSLIPPTALTAGIVYMSYLAFCPESRPKPKNHVNHKICKQESKVVNSVDIEDIADKAAFCRCWKSNNWPYCDGSHGKHNIDTGDNVGPLIVKHRG